MSTPSLESAIEASHKALAAILKGDQSGYLELFSEGRNTKVELIEKYVSESLACVAEVESGEAKVAGSEEMSRVSVRVTSVFRLEAGNWKLVHRHADPLGMPQ